MIHHRRGTRRPTKRASRYEKNRIDNTTSTTWSQENQEQKVRDFERCHCFVIKSFSETNLHKSLKYGIWTSTFVHNRFLDQIYRDELISSSPCPILFFFRLSISLFRAMRRTDGRICSVCKSRHFNGIARMSSPLVKDRKFLLWDKQKYGSFFSVEWLVVKDVPNYILKNIKWNHFAVTNSLVSSRDCEKIPSKEVMQ